MDEIKKELKGSEKLDMFKYMHKKLNRSYYAADGDLVLITKYPSPGVVAYLDYKANGDSVTFSEVILYNEWLKTKPVYIVQGNDPENGPFDIYSYLGGNYIPDPPDVELQYICTVETWAEFEQWEKSIRDKR